MNSNDKIRDDVIDVEYVVHEGKIDTITPVIESRTQIVQDRKGNRLIWLAIAMAVFSFISLVFAFLS